MLPGSAKAEKLLTESLFMDTGTDHRSGNSTLPY